MYVFLLKAHTLCSCTMSTVSCAVTGGTMAHNEPLKRKRSPSVGTDADTGTGTGTGKKVEELSPPPASKPRLGHITKDIVDRLRQRDALRRDINPMVWCRRLCAKDCWSRVNIGCSDGCKTRGPGTKDVEYTDRPCVKDLQKCSMCHHYTCRDCTCRMHKASKEALGDAYCTMCHRYCNTERARSMRMRTCSHCSRSVCTPCAVKVWKFEHGVLEGTAFQPRCRLHFKDMFGEPMSTEEFAEIFLDDSDGKEEQPLLCKNCIVVDTCEVCQNGMVRAPEGTRHQCDSCHKTVCGACRYDVVGNCASCSSPVS